MSRNYKFRHPEGLYFVSFATVYWVDVFVRPIYSNILVDSLKYCQKELGMQLYCWCIMPSHVHLIYRSMDGNPAKLLGRFKEFTAKKIIDEVKGNVKESRREWLLWMFERAGKTSSNVTHYQFWQHHNQPIELFDNELIDQKADYLHHNPVVAGFVEEPHYWRYSSAIDYSGGKGLIAIEYL